MNNAFPHLKYDCFEIEDTFLVLYYKGSEVDRVEIDDNIISIIWSNALLVDEDD